MAPQGHIKISRKAYAEDPFWNEPREFSRWEAWEWLIQAAAWKPYRKSAGRAGILDLGRGETPPLAERYLAHAWGWRSKGRVRRFLELLEEMDRIRTGQRTADGTTYVLVNYDAYQSTRTADGPDNGPQTDRSRTADGPLADQNRSSKAGKAEEEEQTRTSGKADGGRGRNDYPADFEITWVLYPKRSGDNPKKAAHRAWAATVKRGATPEQLQTATLHYAAHVISNGRAGTEYVKLASTFYGPDEPWRDYLEAPPARSTGSSNPWVMPYTPPTPEEIEADANTVTRSMAEFRRQREAGRGAA